MANAPVEQLSPNNTAKQPPHAPDLGVFSNLGHDIPAGLVVFLVALPLCLGIALASGAPPFAGIVAGVMGGVVVPLISRSPLSVSGPAAGLAAIVVNGIAAMGSFQAFLCAVVLGGLLQLALGVARAGLVAYFIPSSVIKGMLSAIGVLLILKQVPHALGHDVENFAQDSFEVNQQENTFTILGGAFGHFTTLAVIISLVSLMILLVFEKTPALKKLFWLPGALVVVVVGTVINVVAEAYFPALALDAKHLVDLPATTGELLGEMRFPDWSALTHHKTWMLAVTVAVVASLETLLNLEAVDKLDPYHRRSPMNRELLAQGAANTLSGLLGGLPVTSVVVRSSANVNAGGRTKAAAFAHGIFMLVAVLLFSGLLREIPLAALAAILLNTGYKLAKPTIFRDMYRLGVDQFTPYLVTILAVVVTDLLRGILIGLAVGLAFVIRQNMQHTLTVGKVGKAYVIRLNKDMYFFSKAALMQVLERLPDGAHVIIDVQQSRFTDYDVSDVIYSFRANANLRRMEVEVRGWMRPPTGATAH